MVENYSFGQSYFQNLRNFYPKVAAIKYGSQFMLHFEGKTYDCVVEIIGPFLFTISIDRKFAKMFYMPHYIVRLVPLSPTIELLPFNPHLHNKILITFLNEVQKTVMSNILNKSRDSTKFYPDESISTKYLLNGSVISPDNLTPVPAILQLSIQQNFGKLLLNYKSQKKINGKTEFNIVIDTSINTICDESWFPSTQFPFIFGIHEIEGQSVFFVCENNDDFYTSFIFIDNLLRIMHKPIFLNKIEQNRFADPFPIPSIRCIWPNSTVFESNINVPTSKSEKFITKLNFKANIEVPEVATSRVKLIDYTKPINRTIFFANSLFPKIQLPFRLNLPQDVQKEDRNKIISDELQNVKEQIDLPLIDFDSLIPEGLVEDQMKLPNYCYKSGEELLMDYISFPNIDERIIEKSNSLNLPENMENDGFPEQKVLAFLAEKVSELDFSVKTNEELLNCIFTVCYCILREYVSVNSIFDFATHISEIDQQFLYCIPFDVNDRLKVFYSRLIEKKHLSNFLSFLSSSSEFLKITYHPFSLLHSPSFICEFIRIITNFEKHVFSIRFDFNDFEDISIPNNSTNSIWQLYKRLETKISYNNYDMRLFSEYFLLLSDFVDDGFICGNSSEMFDSFCIFPHQDIVEIDSKYTGKYRIAEYFVKTTVEHKSHEYFLEIAYKSREIRCYLPNSSMTNLFSVLIVSQTLLGISEFEIDNLDKCLDYL
ncbi:hypothetical protein TVAG_142240 [Trichomonas vaginalis G3]|uniref:Uncharacterized protein n=1 Tax=Trichomonas vaginalis (strain ATCC PRA-98 / G3) TaxID=412133 RepID=A2EHI3_TRIV3|nr:hypothetical protein TVAGG3_0775220 [Trichomonas vaginalis G3]EAY07870.1 hypothetical protein TVAG_142240 [Trichomonas vaginalis G3]KAI5514116.1 hypothetical protein TVAGG3_0775220 [Trichomonas vaginalis G3]|eukprot:XP_001320093.1 hypothetical protein [Trichomonas vaginalis G3]